MRKVGLVLVLVFVVALPMLGAMRHAGDAVAALGVDSFDTTNLTTLGDVDLYRGGFRVGHLTATTSHDGMTSAELSIDGRTLSLKWQIKPVRFWGRADGIAFATSFDETTQTFNDSPGSRQIIQLNRGMIALLSEMLNEIDRLVRHSQHSARSMDWSEPTDNYNVWEPDWMNLDPFSDCPTCSGGGGRWVTICGNDWVNGEAYGGLTKSYLCELAERDANNKCTNGWCLGCCQLLSCDSYCLEGDFACIVAHVAGRACSRSWQ